MLRGALFNPHNKSSAVGTQSSKFLFTMKHLISLLLMIFFSNLVKGKIKPIENQDLVVPQFISAVIHECSKKDPTRNHDVALIQLELGKKSGLIDDIAEIVMRDVSKSSVIIHRSMKPIARHRIHTTSFVVIVSEISDPVRNSLQLFMSHAIRNECFNFIFLRQAFLFSTTRNIFRYNKLSNSAKFIFVPSNIQMSTLVQVFRFFDVFGVTNSILVHRGLTLQVFGSNRFQRVLYEINSNKEKCSTLFPDKLKNMNRFVYKAAITSQAPRVMMELNNKNPSGIDHVIFHTIAKIQNAVIRYIKVPNLSTISKLLLSIPTDIELTLNTALERLPGSEAISINTYDQNGYCALIPLPPRFSLLNFLLTPFDGTSWAFIVVSVVACAVMWRFLKKNRGDSEWRFICSVIFSFVSQGVMLRHNKKIQVLLFQLCLMMAFVLGNCYQSLIVSSMMTSRDGQRMTTFTELFNSDFNFKVDTILFNKMNASGDFVQLVGRMEKAQGFPDFETLFRENYALIARCDMIEHSFNRQTDVEVDKYFYMLPETFMPFYENFLLKPDSPFYDRLQTFHNYVFESGIRQHWKYLLHKKPTAKNLRDENFKKNEEYYLSLDDISGIFYILVFGYTASLLVFIVEVSLKIKASRTLKQTLFVRRFQVAPAVESEIEFCL